MTLGGLVNFESAIFSYDVNFTRDITFAKATFSDRANFKSVSFGCKANFESATFSKLTTFEGANFGEPTATLEVASFARVTFFGDALFTSATFHGRSSFVNAEMRSTTSFEGATFKTEPPAFFGAKLHEGTIWPSNDKWPKPKNKAAAKQFVHAYERLKLEMDGLKKHEDELDFFALELQSRRVLLGPWRGWPIWLYGVLSAYGRSYMRPLVALFVVAAIGAGAFWYFDARTCGEALGLSAANTLNVFGFRRDFGLAIDTPFAGLEVMSALQTILGTILLFLVGVGIRNRFRMK